MSGLGSFKKKKEDQHMVYWMKCCSGINGVLPGGTDVGL